MFVLTSNEIFPVDHAHWCIRQMMTIHWRFFPDTPPSSANGSGVAIPENISDSL